MDEYEASRLRIEKISTAVQCVKESLTCRICLELFNEPVTIKCGHQFCRECILKVTSNENSSCPFCSTKIQKRSIPKDGNKVLQASVKKYENLVKAIQLDSGIDVLEPQNKIKHTKESTYDYEKPSTSKVQVTPSTSRGSCLTVLNQILTKPKVPNPVRSRLSLTKKKTDIKSPSQSSEKNTLHKYLSNKSDPVPDLIVQQSQEKVKNWLETCTSEENDSNATQAQSKNLKDSFTTDQITTPPDQIYCSPQINEIKESDASPLPPSEASSKSKYEATEMRIQEAEMMAKKKKMSLGLKEKNIVKTPSSIPAASHSDASDWRRIKQGGREMQVKTFKTLNVSIEKYSPTVVLDDTVPYNSTNNDSKNFSRESETNNSSVNKTPLPYKKCDPLKSENNNSLNKSSQNVIEDYKHRSMDSTGSPKQEYVAAINVDENQLNEIIGVVPSTSVSKTPKKIRCSSSLKNRSNVSSKLKHCSPSKSKSNSAKKLSDYESSNYDTEASTVIHLQNSPPKKSRLSLKRSRSSANLKDSSPPGTPDKTNEKAKDSSNYFSLKQSESKLLLGPLQNKTNITSQKLTSTNSPLSHDLANRRSSSVSNGCRFIFKKLGRICKKKKQVPFLYLGRLEKEKCIYLDSNSCERSRPVIKSSVPVQIDYKSMMDDQNIANLEEFSSDDSHPTLVSTKGNQQPRSPVRCSPVKNHEEAMNIDEDVDIIDKPGQLNQQMEIDETLPPAKIIVKNDSDLEKRNSEGDEIEVEKLGDVYLKFSKERRKNLEDEEFEGMPPKIYEKVPDTSRSTHQDNTLKKGKTEMKKCSPIPSSSKVDTKKKSSNFVKSKIMTDNKTEKKTNIDRIHPPDDLISISSDDSQLSAHRKNNVKKVSRMNYNESSRTSGRKTNEKFDVESCTDSEVSVTSGIRGEENVENAKHIHSSTSSSLKTVKKKRTHSESSSNEDDNVQNIIGKWIDNPPDQVVKKAKISLDSEEMINVTKRRIRSKYSIDISSDDEQDKVPDVKNQNTEVDVNKLTAMPSSLMSADIFESNEQSMQPKSQVLKQQQREVTNKTVSPSSSDTQSDKENIGERSRGNITVVDARQLRRRRCIPSKNKVNNDEENSERTPEYNKSIKATEEYADEIESSQKNTNKTGQDLDQKEDKSKTVDNFEHESDPYFVRESLLNITQEQIACKNIEKDLFGVDLSKIHENQNEETPDSDKFSTPHRKPKNSEQNDDFDSDNVAPTPVVKRRSAMRFPSSSRSSSKSESNASAMFSPRRNTALIPAITPVKNTKSYPLCHSTPMMNADSPPSLIHSQIEHIKIVVSSLTAENMKLVHKFVDRFDAQYQANFDMDVTHVIVKVDPETKAGPKTFKYIQGIAFKKHVVSFEWIKDCLAKNKLVDADDEKYDVLDPDTLQSGSKKSILNPQKLFNNFAFCCLEPFEKVTLAEFKELLSYNGAVIVNSLAEFHLHKDRLKVIIVGFDEVDEQTKTHLNKVEAVAVFFEWVVDSLSQFEILSLASYFCETTADKARRLGFPPELVLEEDTLEEEDD